VTDSCYLLQHADVVALVREHFPAELERARSNQLFVLGHGQDTAVLRRLYSVMRDRHEGDGPWLEEHSPLRLRDGRALVFVDKTPPLLSLPGEGGSGTGSTAAHRWVRRQLSELGTRVGVARSEVGRDAASVHVVWDHRGFEIELTVPPPGEEQLRFERRQQEGFDVLVAVSDSRDAIHGPARQLPRLQLGGLKAAAKAGASGVEGKALASLWVDNIKTFDSNSMTWDKRPGVRLENFARDLIRQRYEFGVVSRQSESAWFRSDDKLREERRQAELKQWAEDKLHTLARTIAEGQAIRRKLDSSHATASAQRNELISKLREREAIAKKLSGLDLSSSTQRTAFVRDSTLSGVPGLIPLLEAITAHDKAPWFVRVRARAGALLSGEPWTARLDALRRRGIAAVQPSSEDAGNACELAARLEHIVRARTDLDQQMKAAAKEQSDTEKHLSREDWCWLASAHKKERAAAPVAAPPQPERRL